MGCFGQEEFLNDNEFGFLQGRGQVGIIATWICSRNVHDLAFQHPGEVGFSRKSKFPGCLVISVRPDADQSVVRPASMLRIYQQAGTGGCQCGRTFQTQAFAAVQDNQVLSGGDRFRDHLARAGSQQTADGLRLVAVYIADDMGRIFLKPGLAWVDHNERGTAPGSLPDAQEPERGLVIKVRGSHQDGRTLAHIREVGTLSHANLHGQFTAAHGRVEKGMTAKPIRQPFKVEQVLIA